jgi:hypothetical protein
MVDIIAAIKMGKSLADFVEGGPLASALSDIGLRAATNALDKIPHSRAPAPHVWSAVNHLEGAEAALAGTLERHGQKMLWGRSVRLQHLEYKRQYVLCLMAVCYRYLGEHPLADRAFHAAREGSEWMPGPGSTVIAWGVAQLVNPMNWIEWRSIDRYRVQVEELELTVVALPTKSPLSTALRRP